MASEIEIRDNLFRKNIAFCMSAFPNGECDHNATQFFQKRFYIFVEMLKKEDQVDYRTKIFWDVCEMLGASDWMLNVILKNIDPKFDFVKDVTG